MAQLAGSRCILFLLFAYIILFLNFNLINGEDDLDVEVNVEDEPKASEPQAASSGDSSNYNNIDVEGDDSFLTQQTQYTLETLPSSGNLNTAVYVPPSPSVVPTEKNEIKKFYVGEEVTFIVGVSNLGQIPYNLTYISGSLHSPFDYSYYIQNFSVSLINAVVDQGSEISVEFKFKSDPNLEPLPFQLEAYFLYNTTDDLSVYRQNFFNETIELVEKNSEFNLRSLVSYLFIFGVLGGLGYYVYQSKVSKSVLRRNRSNNGANKKAPEWEAPVYRPSDKSKPVIKKRSKKQ